ncbi:MAG: GNAT family N-acetyltransferase [Ardenticatenales bacterium]|nr:GNAT family N-acetyltransferase [Ardenticatenales bacterium]
MQFTQRGYRGPDDLARISELVRAYPQDNPHVVDLPYRLASWSLDTPENTALWEDESGQLMGFAIVQKPWFSLDYLVHPAARPLGLELEILAWGKAHGQAIADEQGRKYPLYIGVREDRPERAAMLEAEGFQRDDWGYVHLACSLVEPLPEPTVPEGYGLRVLEGAGEVEGYVALHRASFGTNNMTIEWRQRLLQLADYQPELDVVAVAPDGQLVAFCVGWLHPDGTQAQVEPLGVHPDFQTLGLGRAVLLEGLRRMQEHGAKSALVNTSNGNDPARHLYESVGFKPHFETVAYGQFFTP